MTVFDFSDFRDFLKFQLRPKLYNSAGRKKSSLAQVSKSLGYASPSLLSMVLNGKRLPSDELCDTLIRQWKLTLKEREYFRLLVQLERKKRQKHDTTGVVEELRRVAGKRAVHVFKELEFSMIREWHYLVIKQLAETPRFQEDPAWISRALRRKITPAQAERALADMERLGVLLRDPETRHLRPSVSDTETTHEIPSAAVRLHQMEMLNRAREALEEQKLEERHFNTLTFNVDSRRLPELKKSILEFLRWANTEFSSASADSVYQLNAQLFEHTSREKTPGAPHEMH